MTVLVWLFIFSTVALSQPLLPPEPGFKPPPVPVCHCHPASPPQIENLSVGILTKGELTPELFSEIMTSVAFGVMLVNTWSLFAIYEHLLPLVRSSFKGGLDRVLTLQLAAGASIFLTGPENSLIMQSVLCVVCVLSSALFKINKEMKDADAGFFFHNRTPPPDNARVCFLGYRHLLEVLTLIWTIIFAVMYVLNRKPKTFYLCLREVIKTLGIIYVYVQFVLTSKSTNLRI